MTICALRRRLCAQLAPFLGDEAAAAVRALLCDYFGYTFTQMVLHDAEEVGEREERELCDMALRLSRHEPLQYVMGRAFFCDMELHVAPGVLIPRPETEGLGQWVAKEIGGERRSVADLCTGSGCIAVALSRLCPQAAVVGVDLSDEALRVAAVNVERYGHGVGLLRSDVLSARSSLGGPYDVVVSNPPYVRLSERASMERNVLEYEPHEALFVPDDDPLLFYRSIAKRCVEGLLRDGGSVFFEINEAYGSAVSDMLASYGFSGVEVRKDFCGRDRMVGARFVGHSA